MLLTELTGLNQITSDPVNSSKIVTDWEAIAKKVQDTDWILISRIENINTAFEVLQNTISEIIDNCKKPVNINYRYYPRAPWASARLVKLTIHKKKTV